MLKDLFFPPPPNADLRDIEGFVYPEEAECPLLISTTEVETAIRRSSADKAPGPDGIPNRILKAMSSTISKLLTPLFQACAMLGYHPIAFRTAHTVALKKPGKPDYTIAKAYRPIALLNTTGKIFEMIMAGKISYLAESLRLLPDSQMGARRGRSTETALELLTEQIHTVWGQGKDNVATLLSVDVAGAYDTVSHPRLLHNLKKRKIPNWIVQWIHGFLKERSTTLSINARSTDVFQVNTGILQGFPLSPILYLFYNADLLDICSNPNDRTASTGFVDDVNILTYGLSTEANCKTLERIHHSCETWAKRHGSEFAPAKYELIHLVRNPKKFNMSASINIANVNIQPKTDIRVLGLQIDDKLRWGPHVKKIQAKMTKQTLALTRLTASTWGATFAKARLLYSAVVRPAITYASSVWHVPGSVKEHRKGTEKVLATVQYRCLRVVSGAYKATPSKFWSPKPSRRDWRITWVKPKSKRG